MPPGTPELVLRNAVRRLLSGPGGQGTQLYDMSQTLAAQFLYEAINELVALREGNAQWVCETCRLQYSQKGQCPTCEEILVPFALVQKDAYLRQIDELQERIRSLERVALQSLDLLTDMEA